MMHMPVPHVLVPNPAYTIQEKQEREKETIRKEKETSVAANPENEKEEKKEKTPRSISYMSSFIEGII